MTTKRCSYKGCNVYTSSAHPVAETFYSFPKHPERLKLWMELGGCPDHREIPYASRYFCSKHFDESKYVANNPRRKQLLSTAIPFPCSESLVQNDMNIDDNEYQCVVSSVHIVEDEEDISDDKFHDEEVSVEVTNEINCISESIEESLETYEAFNQEITDQTDYEEAVASGKKPLKRKIGYSTKQVSLLQPSTNHHQPGSSKRTIAVISNCPTSTINNHQKDEDHNKALYEELEESAAPTESSNVTTFIFKGEEYIQMPKEQYHREKMALMNKLRAYEETLKGVKHLIDSVKI